MTQDCPLSAVKEDFFFHNMILIALFFHLLKNHCSNNYTLIFDHFHWVYCFNQENNQLSFSSCHHLLIEVLNVCMSLSIHIRHQICFHFLYLLRDFEFDIRYRSIYLFKFLAFSLYLIKAFLHFKAICLAHKFNLNCLIHYP